MTLADLLTFIGVITPSTLALDATAWSPADGITVTAEPARLSPNTVLVWVVGQVNGLPAYRQWHEVDLLADRTHPAIANHDRVRVNHLIRTCQDVMRRAPLISPRQFGLTADPVALPAGRHSRKRGHHHHTDND